MYTVPAVFFYNYSVVIKLQHFTRVQRIGEHIHVHVHARKK